MELGHLHIGFKDLPEAIGWVERVLEKKPVYQNPRMAVFSFAQTSLVFDSSDEDTSVTIAFDSRDCSSDFEALTSRGAVVLEPPAELPWGVRAAYLHGPGRAVVEIEQRLE